MGPSTLIYRWMETKVPKTNSTVKKLDEVKWNGFAVLVCLSSHLPYNCLITASLFQLQEKTES